MTFYNAIWQLLFHFFIVLILVFAAVGFAAGMGLIFASAPTRRVFQLMNRWISTRGALRAFEIPRDTEQLSHRHPRLVGWGLILGGLVATLGLLLAVNTAQLDAAVAKGDTRVLVAVICGTLKWFLVGGGAAGVVVGGLLAFAPDALARLEKYANRWSSTQLAVRGADDMHSVLDRLVEAHPAPAGWILAFTTLGAAAGAVALLLART
ncbi:MAG: hypothetical protein ACREVQ_15080 [Burkholderiales bacterium]